MTKNKQMGVKNVVLVHGGFVDGSAGKACTLSSGSVATTSPWCKIQPRRWPTNVALTKRALAAQDGPAILVGHSYGGVVVTEAGNDRRWLPSSTSRRSRPTLASPSLPSSRIRLRRSGASDPASAGRLSVPR